MPKYYVESLYPTRPRFGGGVMLINAGSVDAALAEIIGCCPLAHGALYARVRVSDGTVYEFQSGFGEPIVRRILVRWG
ncbi:hypothetical protein [Ancylobacter terrae]|uniref:hypothetical protein n=1 Tax=Ancylobacter sp. sgz301288 TaxID=3342077 RepID=UPI00385D5AB6